ncbi:hypothetical protein CDL12_23953 [Handroanthus impetiginosus]|uniref:Shikimate O-hydroxycinnamoyltransferase n=1 Tax=Handroanthus impetiginosus TaxID=429701 RepID=A0A2G9GE09_9LAMI|nr:hypothetical protein CDL12_23953 [Handroanthus impetiginosus]
MPLTDFDQTGMLTHIPTFYFYKPSQNWLTQKDTIFTILKTSLSQLLVYFYPLAGRLRWIDGARLELDCNEKGVQLVEAQCEANLDDLGEFTPSPEYDSLIPQINYFLPLYEIPLLFVQLTQFKCGGVTLGIAVSHAIADGKSAFHFIKEWANLARGQPLETEPFLDRKLLRAGETNILSKPRFHHAQFDPQPLMIGELSNENERKKETTMFTLKLSKIQVEMLKKEANRMRPSHISPGYTRYEAVAGHMWRSACKARRHRPDQPTRIVVFVDVRRRMQPPLPPKFFGNAIIDVTVTSSSGEVINKPLGYTSSRIREAIDGVTSEYVNSIIDFLKNLKDFSMLQDIHVLRSTGQGPYSGNPNLMAISWIGLPIHGVDFGWGKEIFMVPGTNAVEGESMIMPGHDGDGSVVIVLRLQAACVEDFKKFFYEDIEKNNYGLGA